MLLMLFIRMDLVWDDVNHSGSNFKFNPKFSLFFLREEQDFEYARIIQEEIQRRAEEAQRREQDDEVSTNPDSMRARMFMELITFIISSRSSDHCTKKKIFKKKNSAGHVAHLNNLFYTILSEQLSTALPQWTHEPLILMPLSTWRHMNLHLLIHYPPTPQLSVRNLFKLKIYMSVSV